MSPRHSRGKGQDAPVSHAYKPLSLKRRAWITVGAVVLGGAGVTAYAMAGEETPAADAPVQARGSEVHSVELSAAGTGKRALSQRSTDDFSLVGLTWDKQTAELDGTAQVRVRSSETGAWSGWQTVEAESHLPDPGTADAKSDVVGMSESRWVGPSDGVEARVVAADGSASALPKGLSLTMVDPGVTKKEAAQQNAAQDYTSQISAQNAAFSIDESPSASASPTASASASATATASASASDTASPTGSATSTAAPTPSDSATVKPPAPASTVAKPPMIMRSEWKPDTSKAVNYSPPEYIDKIQAAFVHHTVDTNNYSCSQSAAIVRADYLYHVTPRPAEHYDGWKDIGYNFLVDKCGQIFEGREGGVDEPVLGAHTYGFNSYSTGIAILGNYVDNKPSRAALESVARVAAYKLGQYGVSPTGSVTLVAKADTGKYTNGQSATLKTIAGHLDAFATECPGTQVEDRLGTIRTYAAGAGASSAIPSSDVNKDGLGDVVSGMPKGSSGGQIVVVPGGTAGPDSAKKKLISQSSTGVPGAGESGDEFGAATATGDINGDGYADIVVGQPGEDDTSGHTDRGAYTILYGPNFTTGEGVNLDGSYDLTNARFGSAVAVGDFNADGKADVFAASSGLGGTWSARYGDGWDTDSMITTGESTLAYEDATSGDFNDDGYADVALNYRDGTGVGRVVWYKGGEGGLRKAATLAVKGGRSIAAGDINGNGVDDIVIGQPYTAESGAHSGGQVTAVYGVAGTGLSTGVSTISQSTSGVPGASESGDAMGSSVAIGDYNADGYGDVLTGAPNEDITRTSNRSNAGTSLLLKGTSAGLTGTGALAVSQDEAGVPGSTETNDNLGSAAALVDVQGFGRASLVLGVAGEDAGNGTLLYVPTSDPATGAYKWSLSLSKYYGLTQFGTKTGARLGTNLAP
ncbi:FG-GAP-like repeat-containing protein [Streptomyces sp. NPDC052225]|uniref:FG-GAP-like repeat-containing protein n=1 Tax=Streptomyces sp. NPDC052225 TaxID=3154949 RepID=UPI0034285004